MVPDIINSSKVTQEKISKIDKKQVVVLSPQQWQKIIAEYQKKFPQETVFEVGGHTLVNINRKGQTKYVSCQEFPKLFFLVDLFKDLLSFESVLNKLSEAMGLKNPQSDDENNVFKVLPSETAEKELGDRYNSLIDAIDKSFPDADDQLNIKNFLFSSNDGKKLNRGDWMESVLYKAGGLVAASSAGRAGILEVLEKTGIDPNSLHFVSNQQEQNTLIIENNSTRKTGGINRIYYGAPGTGKSYTVEKSSRPETRTTTVFHSDFQNSDFVGALKPVMSDGSVTYKFSPGPFAIALKEAWLDPENMHYLVIEELNRAPAASVFGELFQLLDRDNNGNSQYEIDFPSEEFASWWRDETGEEGKMRLPSNLSILATMNSADQGVYPLDTAFRRRWEHEYIPLDYKKAPEGQIGLRLKDDETPRTVEWSVFLKRLNQYFVEKINDLPEDRLIGPYFLSGYDLDNAKNSIPEKLLIYIWDDLLRHTGRQEIFVSSIKTYGDLVRRNENGKVIFSEAFLARFDDGNGVVS